MIWHGTQKDGGTNTSYSILVLGRSRVQVVENVQYLIRSKPNAFTWWTADGLSADCQINVT